MANQNTPNSFAMSAVLNVAASQALTALAQIITVYNRGTAEVFITVDGSTPTVGGNAQWYLPAPAGSSVEITMSGPNQAEAGSGDYPVVQAISSAALLLYVVVNQ